MMFTTRPAIHHRLPLFIGILIMLGTAASFASAQPDLNPGNILWRVEPGVDRTTFETFQAAVNAELTRPDLTQIGHIASQARYTVQVDVYPGPSDAPTELQFVIRPHPPRESLMSPSFETELVSLALTPSNPQELAALIAALHGYSETACNPPQIETLRQPDHPQWVALEYVYARCLYQARDYAASTAVLRASQPAAETLVMLWQAAIAQNLAQSFQFDAALALDDMLIAALEASSESLPPEDSAMLAELYLLRGQHRLYLYEWDQVLADYEAALALNPEHARAYYLRGMLHMTTNSRQAALEDFTRFLALDHTRPIPDEHPAIITQAEAYAAELTRLLATPQAN